MIIDELELDDVDNDDKVNETKGITSTFLCLAFCKNFDFEPVLNSGVDGETFKACFHFSFLSF